MNTHQVLEALDSAQYVYYRPGVSPFVFAWFGGLQVNVYEVTKQGIDNIDCFSFAEIPNRSLVQDSIADYNLRNAITNTDYFVKDQSAH